MFGYRQCVTYMNYAKLVSIRMMIKSHSIVVSDVFVWRFTDEAPSEDLAVTDDVEWVFIIGSIFADDNDVIVVVGEQCNTSVDILTIWLKMDDKSIVS